MAGFALGQSYGVGRTFQHTVRPGQVDGFPLVTAGADYTASLQRYDRWRLVAVTFDLTTDANAANRYVQVQYLDGTGVPIARDITAAVQVASKVFHYSGALDSLVGVDALTNVTASFRLSGLWLEAGQRINVQVGAVQVGDAFTNMRFTFDTTLIPADGSQDEYIVDLEHQAA